jgi:hypothetical protein
MLQRLVLYATLGLVLDAVDQNIDQPGFWCILALFVASEWMTRREVLEQVERELRALHERQQQQKQEEEQ